MPKFDSEEEIVKAKVYKAFSSLFDEYLKSGNSKGKQLFDVCGLSKFFDSYYHENAFEYWDKINPYYYNGTWPNPNPSYDPIFVFNDLLEKIEETKINEGINKDYRYEIFKVLIEENKPVVINEYIDDTIINGLLLLGYEFKRNNNKYEFNIISTSNSVKEMNISILEKYLKDKEPDIYNHFEEARNDFLNSKFKSSVAMLRVVLEDIYGKDNASNLDYKKVLEISDEMNDEFRAKQIVSFGEIIKKESYAINRTRLIAILWGVTSGFGSHDEEEPNKQDAFMFLNIIEDVLIWHFLKDSI